MKVAKKHILLQCAEQNPKTHVKYTPNTFGDMVHTGKKITALFLAALLLIASLSYSVSYNQCLSCHTTDITVGLLSATSHPELEGCDAWGCDNEASLCHEKHCEPEIYENNHHCNHHCNHQTVLLYKADEPAVISPQKAIHLTFEYTTLYIHPLQIPLPNNGIKPEVPPEPYTPPRERLTTFCLLLI